MKKKFKEGMKVLLPANKREGWKEERGSIIGVQADCEMLVVQLDRACMTEPDDDGIREVAFDQVKPL